MGYVIIVLLGYLLGSSNLAFYLSKWKQVDLRGNGSGNYGASNTTILMGWGAGVTVGVHDIGKAILAVMLARLLFPQLEYAAVVAGVASVLGHIFPFYLKFKGGKGFACFYGMTIALNWQLALAVGAVIVLVTLVTDYLFLGTMATVILVPLGIGILTGNWWEAAIICVATAVIIYKHRMNFVKLHNGTEIGLRATAKGKHRIK